jgi:myo-inositol-1(or 4)-monophosphatase
VHKVDGSEVTDADRACEASIVEGLGAAFAGDGIVGEEGVAILPRDGHGTWYVDPIDGTGAFLDELAHWGPTVCYVRAGVLELGGLWLPRLGELWWGERGAGAWRDDVRLGPPADPAITRLSSLYLPSRFHRHAPLDWPGKVRAVGSSAVHLAQVAVGGGFATIIPRWKLWDVGCGVLLVEEAGRRVVTLAGTPFDPLTMPDEPFIAGTPAAIAHLTRALRTG